MNHLNSLQDDIELLERLPEFIRPSFNGTKNKEVIDYTALGEASACVMVYHRLKSSTACGGSLLC